MQSKAATVAEYLASLPAERREAISAVRDVFRRNLDPGYREGMHYGMIGYCVPHELFPAGYHCDPKQPLPFAGIASQKNHMSLYLMVVQSDGADDMSKWFREAWRDTGKKLDMGKSCIRFKKIDDLALEVIGEAIRRLPVKKFVAHYQALGTLNPAGKPRGKGRPAAKKRTVAAAKKKAPKARTKASGRR